MQTLTAQDPNWVKGIFVLASMLVLFAVFLASAVAFVLTIFGKLNPTATTRAYLFGLFAVSVVGIFTGLVKGFFDPNVGDTIAKIRIEAARESAAESMRALDAASPQTIEAQGGRRIVVFTQVGSQSDLGKGRALNNSLPKTKYETPPVDNVKAEISANQIRFCNDQNKADAQALADFLKARSFNPFSVVKIGKCDANKNLNILEAWVQSDP